MQFRHHAFVVNLSTCLPQDTHDGISSIAVGACCPLAYVALQHVLDIEGSPAWFTSLLASEATCEGWCNYKSTKPELGS